MVLRFFWHRLFGCGDGPFYCGPGRLVWLLNSYELFGTSECSVCGRET